MALTCLLVGKSACHIILPSRETAARRGWDQDIIRRHEIGHCDGWPEDHPDARMATKRAE